LAPGQLIDDKKAEIAQRVAELQDLAGQLDNVRAAPEASPPPQACRTDLSCCVPETAAAEPVLVEMIDRQACTPRH
jgi:hypothetical protein